MSRELLAGGATSEEERAQEATLRPQRLLEFVGQRAIKGQLQTMLSAAKRRAEPLDHVLFYGPPGLGKTTLAQIIASEMGTDLRITSGPAVDHQGVLGSILTGLNTGDIFFVDEIHRLNRTVEEALYPAMEDFAFDVVAGKGPGAQAIRLDLLQFTVVGATTKAGALSKPFRDRFGATFRLDFYEVDELCQIIQRSAALIGVTVQEQAATLIAARSRGTPRVANRLLRRVRDHAEVHGTGVIDEAAAAEGLGVLGIDDIGLDDMDRRVLQTLCQVYAAQAVGVQTIAVSLHEDPGTVEDVVEPFLMRCGLMVRTKQGRMATAGAYRRLGLEVPAGVPGAQVPGQRQVTLDGLEAAG